ncbi:unnamed protein product [Gongylonema pulchrum]|uniref:Uncharacterized protein n=1 Tax=Gongylonema pulchrum TaxID=637853 RepID=A0A183DNP6_9BILA|nr:unnamed protein product [Gongylonema pulchrum]
MSLCFWLTVTDLESLLEATSQQHHRPSLDYLATPRRGVPLPPTDKKISMDHHARSVSTLDYVMEVY